VEHYDAGVHGDTVGTRAKVAAAVELLGNGANRGQAALSPLETFTAKLCGEFTRRAEIAWYEYEYSNLYI
jgi:hypothetical protein